MNKPIQHRNKTAHIVFVKTPLGNPVKELQNNIRILMGIDDIRDMVRSELGAQVIQFRVLLPLKIRQNFTNSSDQVWELTSG